MTDINVLQTTQRIVVDVASSTVSVINAGPVGPAGPAGEVSAAQLATKVDLAGDTMTGDLVIEGDQPLVKGVGVTLKNLADSVADNQRYRVKMVSDDIAAGPAISLTRVDNTETDVGNQLTVNEGAITVYNAAGTVVGTLDLSNNSLVLLPGANFSGDISVDGGLNPAQIRVDGDTASLILDGDDTTTGGTHSRVALYRSNTQEFYVGVQGTTGDVLFYHADVDVIGYGGAAVFRVNRADGSIDLGHSARDLELIGAVSVPNGLTVTDSTLALLVESSSPIVEWHDTDGVVNGRRWQVLGADNVLRFQILNDDDTVKTVALDIQQDGVVKIGASATIEVPTPTTNPQATTKLYVDTADGANATAASNAQSTADTAVTNAASAQSTADTAVTNAASAQSTADTAVTNAASAQSDATQALSDSASAQSDATQALADASAAQSDATQALTDKVNRAGDTMTGDLLIAKDNPRITLDASGTNDESVIRFLDGGLRRLEISRNPSTGDLTFTRYNSSGVFQDSPFRVGSDGRLYGIAPAGSGQVATISTWSATTGQRVIGGTEVGSTGPRNITSVLENGWGSLEVTVLQRAGYVCSLGFGFLDKASATSDTFYTLPLGFRPVNRVKGVVHDDADVTANMDTLEVQTGGVVRFDRTFSGPYFYGTLTWLTDDAWPATLPGTAI